MNVLDHCFERIVIISLPGREDRRSRCAAHLAALKLTQQAQWFDAVDGRRDPPPPAWNSGPGAWGCHRSHLAIIRQAIRDRLDSVLILEDDAIFSPHTSGALGRFLKAVPEDWGQIYLGGQHLRRTVATASPLVVRGTDVNRTHAYAVSGREALRIADYLDQWPARRNVAHHIDHHMGLGHRMRLWAAYAPVTWFAGQMEAVSDINAGEPDLPERWWHSGSHSMQLPLVAVGENERITPAQEALLRFPRRPSGAASQAGLYTRLLRLAAEAATHGRLPAWRGPATELRRIRRLWHNPVLRVQEALTLCPHNTTQTKKTTTA